jgi:hypothetical protein
MNGQELNDRTGWKADIAERTSAFTKLISRLLFHEQMPM